MSNPSSKTEPVTLVYKDNKIFVQGEGIEAILEISSSELKKMYWNGKGNGKVTYTHYK